MADVVHLRSGGGDLLPCQSIEFSLFRSCHHPEGNHQGTSAIRHYSTRMYMLCSLFRPGTGQICKQSPPIGRLNSPVTILSTIHDQSRVPFAYVIATIATMMTHSSPPAGEQPLQRARSKREQVLVACKVCRGRKTKVRCVVKPILVMAHHRRVISLALILTSVSV